MPEPTSDPLQPLIKRWLQSDDPDATLESLCREHPEHAAALRARCAASTSAGAAAGAAQPDPEQVGPYRILDKLGEGGMGTVYLAQQEQPVQRQVALKLIKLGMDSVEIVRRFEQERQALALMDHEGIAKVFDCGTTERGQPYFVMELVKGVPLDTYCDQNRLSLTDRLLLVKQVCAAVQHAHQKGVIHRDLKPGNVLVSSDTGRLQVKIIDFGLAKAMGKDLIEATLHTEIGRVMGTPEYMAPEQADPSNEDVDTRADVYSLGVMLYQLLVGELPFSAKELRRAGLMEMQRVLREVEPPKPSTKLTTLGGQTTHHAAQLRVSASALKKALKGDLDWVVVKALEKDRNRRYESANAMAEDLQRFLEHEPLVAGPPSAAYRLQKLARRYRLQLVAAALVLVASLAFGSVAFVQWQNASQLADEKAGLLKSEQAARAAAQQNLVRFEAKSAELGAKVDEFNQLAGVVRCEELVAEARALLARPAWPSYDAARAAWLRDCDALLETRDGSRRAIQSLRQLAVPWDEAARAAVREESPELFAEWEYRGHRLAAVRYELEMRAGKPVTVVELSEELQALSPAELNAYAWARVSPNERDRSVWGEAPTGLAAAQRAVAKSDGDPERFKFLYTLAWALAANGQESAARQASRDTLRAAPAQHRDALASWEREFEGHLQGVEERLAAAEYYFEERPVWKFSEEHDAEAFLHDALVELLAEMGRLESQQREAVLRQQAWSARVRSLTLAHPNARVTWSAVREGVAASSLYADSSVPLSNADVEQRWLGLVPLGPNPRTGYHEFYHLRSAWDGLQDPGQIEVPRHRADGSIEVTPATGVVLVLLPGGEHQLGSQREDRQSPHYDPGSRALEEVHEVQLDPFLVARHELTKAQWQRLWLGDPELARPSIFVAGRNAVLSKSAKVPITLVHPVEGVDWGMCDALVRAHGLRLPTEAQWEYAGRGLTSSPWSCVESELSRHANLHDLAGARASGRSGGEQWDDRFVLHAPVGSLSPNPFGLYDVHGNVREWCADLFGYYGHERVGDGLRTRSGSRYGDREERVHRGGSYASPAGKARSAFQGALMPSTRGQDLGFRAARSLVAR